MQCKGAAEQREKRKKRGQITDAVAIISSPTTASGATYGDEYTRLILQK